VLHQGQYCFIVDHVGIIQPSNILRQLG
jgi:hypothetical protein